MLLTTTMINDAKAKDKAYKLSDGDCLHIHVATTGHKSWRFRYRKDKKEQLLTIGSFPEVSLKEARERRDEAKRCIRIGKDPSESKRKLVTLQHLCSLWYEHNYPDWSKQHREDVLNSFLKDIYPTIGKYPARDVTSGDILEVLQNMEKRGSAETARRLRRRLSCVFNYGEAYGIVTSDPAEKLIVVLKKPKPIKHQPALLCIEECKIVYNAREKEKTRLSVIQAASRFLALTAVRYNCVRYMKWQEIEGLNSNNPIWKIPAERMKLSQQKKKQSTYDHIVPLSPPAVSLLKSVKSFFLLEKKRLSPDSYVFSLETPSTILSTNCLRDLYDRIGYSGIHVPHGWRASFSTILNEVLGEGYRRLIDQSLAHQPKDKVEAAYNRSEQFSRRREIFHRWAGLLYSDLDLIPQIPIQRYR